MAKILLIDDDLDLAFLTEQALKKDGHEVLVFHEVMGGMREARDKKPDLILMDVMMPGMTGPEAVQKFRSDPDLKKIPVIFVTALLTKDDHVVEEMGIKVAGLKYKALAKPFEIEELLSMIKKTLG